LTNQRLSAGELSRKLVHILSGGFAFLLRDLTWPQAALMALAALTFNALLLPRIGGRRMWREGEHGAGYPLGILLYPISVLLLILALRHNLWMAAAVWGVLAAGDGMASIVGQAVGGPRLFWNPRKGWVGFLAFVVSATLAASILTAWTLRLPLAAWSSVWILTITVPLALLCALTESLPTTLDDNLTVPLVGGCLVPLLASVDLTVFFGDDDMPHRVAVGLAVNGVIAALAWTAHSIDFRGGVSAVVIGTLVTAGLGLPGLGLLIAFFVLGSTATRLGYRIKVARGIAQEKGGARGWRNAWANGGIPALLALLAGFTTADTRGLLVLAYAAAVATAAADTCSSEVGKAYGRRTFLITTLRPVPAGTEGAVSLEGTLGGLGGAAVVGALGAALGLYGALGAVAVAAAGLLGSLVESVVGTVAERRGWMGNDLLNAFNTAVGAAVVVPLARLS
jgi:uncharacterized protein (TIGR00297 family)